MSKRTASWFVREIKKQTKLDPAGVVRLDITEADIEAIHPALKKLPDGWTVFTMPVHADPVKRKKGLIRVAFCGPKHRPARPLIMVKVKRRKGESAKAAATRYKKQLQAKYGPDYEIETTLCGGLEVDTTLWPSLRQPGGDIPTQFICMVWHGLEILKRDYAAVLSFNEIAEFLRVNIGRAEQLAPLARDGQAYRQRMKDMRDKQKELRPDHTRRNRDIRLAYEAARSTNPFHKKTEIQKEVGSRYNLSARRVRDIVNAK